ncbi:MAG: hypothetical protein Q8M26_18465 [Pseudolabrys sp.]|nr:hypothetical protein [Pseudolabrys sp.]
MTANVPTQDDATAGAAATLIDLGTRARRAKVETKIETRGDGEAAGGLATAHPKPAKRKNARERANDKAAAARAAGSDKNDAAKDGTTPMTAKAKSAAAYQEERQAAKVAAKKEKTAAKSAAKSEAKKAKGKAGR